jgi:cytochrome c6
LKVILSIFRLAIFRLAIASLAIVIALLFNFTFIHPALAAEIATGSVIFTNNCASCHIGGGNILIEYKNLHKEALLKYLENYETNPLTAIINQIQNGKNAMPPFKAKLTEEEILEVATYVFQKSETGW